MQYFILVPFLIIYFELLGQSVLNQLKVKRLPFNFHVGFITFLVLTYVLYFPFAIKAANFKVFLILTLAIIVVTSLFILLNAKKIRLNFSLRELIVTLLIVVIYSIIQSYRSNGELIYSDTFFYTSLVGSNVLREKTNMFNVVGGQLSGVIMDKNYALQSYYMFASVFIYLARSIFSRIGLDYIYYTGYIWTFLIISYYFKITLLINLFDELKINNKKVITACMFFWVGFYYLLYLDFDMGFYGNSFRMGICAYMSLYIYDYLKTKNSAYLILFIIASVAGCAVSSSGIMISAISAFCLYVVGIKNNKKILGYCAVSLILPLTNLIYSFADQYTLLVFVVLLVATLFVIVFDDSFGCFIIKLKLDTILPMLAFIVFVIGGFILNDFKLDISPFFNNLSEVADGTWDYTDWTNLVHIFINILFVFPISVYLYKNRKDAFSKYFLLMVILFFTPLQAYILNRYNVVYYRSYDLVINQFTIILAFDYISSKENINKLNADRLLMCTTLLLPFILCYYRDNEFLSFKTKDGWNPVYKMTNDEKDAIIYTIDNVNYQQIERPRLITSIYQIQGELKEASMMYGLRKTKYEGTDELAKIFYPVDYTNDPYAPKNPQYEKMCGFLGEEKNRFDIIIQDKNVLYYDESNDTYYSLTYLINRCFYPSYENDNYAVYFCEYE